MHPGKSSLHLGLCSGLRQKGAPGLPSSPIAHVKGLCPHLPLLLVLAFLSSFAHTLCFLPECSHAVPATWGLRLGWGQCSFLPSPRTSALPPLDWPLPSQYEQLELRIEVQPRAHHRAHYETEGSRGAVKAAPGGHPVVKVRGQDQEPA